VTEHWYDEAVIYRLDVETFADSDGDGIGDFRGLGYLCRLGITCLWLNPVHPAPNRTRAGVASGGRTASGR
jgi:maltose alpha-D-glucosyltransferase / alpha-amylase